MFVRFQLAEKAGGKGRTHLNENQEKWIQMQSKILSIEPYNNEISKAKGFRKNAIDIITSQQYSIFISIFPLSVVILMMMQDYNLLSSQIKERDYILNWIFLSFAIIFTCEIFFKIHAFSLKGYFSYQWNIIEFIIGVAYVISAIIDFSVDENMVILRKCFKLFRILAIFRLIHRLRFLRKLKQTLAFKLPLIMRILYLSLIFLFVYALFGAFLFANINNDEAESLDEKLNFDNVFKAMALLFVCATGENWSLTLLDTIKYQPSCENYHYLCGSRNIYYLY